MRALALALLLTVAVASPAFAAPFLAWDAVTTDPQGLPLGVGLGITSYNVYKCGTTIAGTCAAPDRILVGTVLAPALQFDLAVQAFPQVYVVTAVNKVGESQDSIKFKVTPGDAPKNPRLP